MNKRNIFKVVIAVWVVLWLFFLVREDKDGQYNMLAYLYTQPYEGKVRYIMGSDLYDFLVFCKKNIPEGSTYEISGFERFSIDEVRARYFLWPLRSVGEGAEFKIVYSQKDAAAPGYQPYKSYSRKNNILIREGSLK